MKNEANTWQPSPNIAGKQLVHLMCHPYIEKLTTTSGLEVGMERHITTCALSFGIVIPVGSSVFGKVKVQFRNFQACLYDFSKQVGLVLLVWKLEISQLHALFVVLCEYKEEFSVLLKFIVIRS